MLQVTFPEVVSILQSAGSNVPAAEGHGCLCGALCITDDYSLDRWLEELVPVEEGGAIAADTEQTMRLLYADTLQALRGDDMRFQPFLPDDDTNLAERARALAQWCQGFLYGLGTARPLQPEMMPKSIDEILLDFTGISRAEVDPGEDPEEDEQAYAEVVEYVRAATQTIHDELDEVRGSNAAEPVPDVADDDESHPLH